jgi:ribosome-associated toxin RatA of RatAB toxin-antitoxin module
MCVPNVPASMKLGLAEGLENVRGLVALLVCVLLVSCWPIASHGQSRVQAQILPDASGQGGRVRASVLIAASPQTVWGVMIDCSGAPRFVPGLRSCAIESRAPDGASDIRVHRISWLAGFPLITIRFASRYRTNSEIHFERISGDIAAMRGSWVLTPQDGGRATLLSYEAHLVPSRLLPSTLVRSALQRDTPKILEAIRAEAIARSTPRP